tara:strand:- start:277 stop:1353 length:1077 start_codon:yes stop_codon:yes gene_type:complete
MSAFEEEEEEELKLNINEYFDPKEVAEANKEYHNLNKDYPYGADFAAAALTGFAKGVDQRLKEPIFREDSPPLMRQDTTETKRASPGLTRQMSDLSFDNADGEVKEIMTRPSTPRLQELHRGSSRLRTPEEQDKDAEELNKKQKNTITDMRHQVGFAYSKSAKKLQQEIDLLESKENLGEKDIDRIELLKKKLKNKKGAVNFSLRSDSPPLRRHSIGGKTRKKRKTKRRKRRKTKRRKGKKGGGFFSRRKKSSQETPDEKKRRILMLLLNNDEQKVEKCLELNDFRKSCHLDKTEKKISGISPSCVHYNGLNKGPVGRMCGNVLRQAAIEFQRGSAKKRRTKRRKRKRRNSTRRKKRS